MHRSQKFSSAHVFQVLAAVLILFQTSAFAKGVSLEKLEEQVRTLGRSFSEMRLTCSDWQDKFITKEDGDKFAKEFLKLKKQVENLEKRKPSFAPVSKKAALSKEEIKKEVSKEVQDFLKKKDFQKELDKKLQALLEKETDKRLEDILKKVSNQQETLRKSLEAMKRELSDGLKQALSVYSASIEKRLQALEENETAAEISKLEKQLAKLEKKLQEAESARKSSFDSFAALQDGARKALSSRLESKLSQLSKRLDSFSKSPETEELKTSIKALTGSLEGLKQKEKRLSKEIADLKRAMKKGKAEVQASLKAMEDVLFSRIVAVESKIEKPEFSKSTFSHKGESKETVPDQDTSKLSSDAQKDLGSGVLIQEAEKARRAPVARIQDGFFYYGGKKYAVGDRLLVNGQKYTIDDISSDSVLVRDSRGNYWSLTPSGEGK